MATFSAFLSSSLGLVLLEIKRQKLHQEHSLPSSRSQNAPVDWGGMGDLLLGGSSHLGIESPEKVGDTTTW